jgi:hypothetical protein
MARTKQRPVLLRREPGSHPRPLLGHVPGLSGEQCLLAEIGCITVRQLDRDSVVFLPLIDYTEDPIEAEPEAEGPRTLTVDSDRVWKTTFVYEMIAEIHPRIAR